MKRAMLASLLTLSMLTACGTQQSYLNTPIASRTKGVTVGAADHQFSLQLVQKKPSAASDIPPVSPDYGMTQLTLPLYPGASSTSQKFSQAFEETPISWYVRTGKAEYLASANSSSLEAWYLKYMAVDGYHQTGSASMGNVKTGTTAKGFAFQPVHQVSGHQVEVDISFETLSSGKTLFEFWATDLVVPPRPTTNFLPNNVTRVDGEMTVYGSKVTKYKVDITDQQAIQRLVSTSNSLSKLIQGDNPGGPMIWGTAKLTFQTSTGKSIPVVVNTDSLTIGNVGLEDYKGAVWTALEQVMGVHGPN